MRPDPFAERPRRPRDVGEWEDLLIRFELAPRALRLAMESAPNGIDTADPTLDGVAEEMNALAEREAEAWGWMQALREGRPLRPWSDLFERPVPAAPLREYLDRFASSRARNFAWVQRRGLVVWDWESDHPDFGSVTAFQLISFLVREDGRRLARVRDAFRAAEPC
jgi:hypothetical protein